MEGCEKLPKFWSLEDLDNVCKDSKKLVKFLQYKNLLKGEEYCSKCGGKMTISGSNWRCNKRIKSHKKNARCNLRFSMRKGTWFSYSKLNYEQVLKITFLLLNNYDRQQISDILNVNKNTITQWNTYLKQVLIKWLEKHSEPLGGPGKTVETEECKYGSKKVCRGQLVFGGVERDSTKIFITPMQDRKPDTIVSLMKKWILPGSTVVSDCWTLYKDLDKEGYDYLTKDHAIKFVDYTTDSYLNDVNTSWRRKREAIPFHTRRKSNFVKCLANYFFENLEKKNGDLFEIILNEIGQLNFEFRDCVNEGDGEGGDEDDSQSEED